MRKVVERIVIAEDFTDTPGARYKTDGKYSGEEFYEEILLKKFLKAVEHDGLLLIDLDDVWGYPSSFISGSFGILSIKQGAEKVLQHVEFKSEGNPLLAEKFVNEIKNPTTKFLSETRKPTA